MRNYIERAEDFIKAIYPFICDSLHDRCAVFNAVRDFNATYNRKVICRHGCVRIALITSDYVVKFDYNEEEVPFLGGGEKEVRIYNMAKEDGFDYLFAPITPYEYEHNTFYIMPRINGIGREEYDDNYAEELMTEEESEYISELGLSDLHNYNFGFRKGKICLVDYACVCGYSDD